MPSAKDAATATNGSSSIAFGIISPLISVACKLLERARMSPIGSPFTPLSFMISMSPPIFFRISITPVLSGLIPTFFIRTSEPGVIRAATIKKAAEDKSEGTIISPELILETLLIFML